MIDINKVKFSSPKDKTNKSYSLDRKNIQAIAKVADQQGIKDSTALNDILNAVFSH